MKLISCESCGIVVDTDRITFTVIEHEYAANECVFWCPCCDVRIQSYNGDIN